MKYRLFSLALFFAVALVVPVQGSAELFPEEILVVANKKAARSVGLAGYYMQQRNIPSDNLLQVWITDKEVCSRKEYEKSLVAPVRRYLQKEGRSRIRCLVLVYGVPLKVKSPELSGKEKRVFQKILQQKQNIADKLQISDSGDRERLEEELKRIKQKIRNEQSRRNMGASVDSELALVQVEKYSLSMWIPNPFCLQFQNRQDELPVKKKQVLFVSRLDGPDPQTVKRIIDDSLQAEKKGLQGRAYFDARWSKPEQGKKLSGYALYDNSVHRAAKFLQQIDVMEVNKESTEHLFQPGDCPQTALYCGWYSLARYVDAFTWEAGSIGYHIASSECTTLKGKSQVWCKRMLEKGVAATLGPVSEPYVQAFPLPEIFFRVLLDGFWSLGECYFLSLPYLSWKMVLVGDPLYRPFKNRSWQ